MQDLLGTAARGQEEWQRYENDETPHAGMVGENEEGRPEAALFSLQSEKG